MDKLLKIQENSYHTQTEMSKYPATTSEDITSLSKKFDIMIDTIKDDGSDSPEVISLLNQIANKPDIAILERIANKKSDIYLDREKIGQEIAPEVNRYNNRRRR